MSKKIIVTGASKGIGLATAQSLLKEGHNVFLVARTENPLKKLKEEFPGRVDYLVGDLADFEVCECGFSLFASFFFLFCQVGS